MLGGHRGDTTPLHARTGSCCPVSVLEPVAVWPTRLLTNRKVHGFLS